MDIKRLLKVANSFEKKSQNRFVKNEKIRNMQFILALFLNDIKGLQQTYRSFFTNIKIPYFTTNNSTGIWDKPTIKALKTANEIIRYINEYFLYDPKERHTKHKYKALDLLTEDLGNQSLAEKNYKLIEFINKNLDQIMPLKNDLKLIQDLNSIINYISKNINNINNLKKKIDEILKIGRLIIYKNFKGRVYMYTGVLLYIYATKLATKKQRKLAMYPAVVWFHKALNMNLELSDIRFTNMFLHKIDKEMSSK